MTAILHEGTSVRFWDHDLGPARPRLLAASPIAAGPGGGELLTWTDLTPAPGGALDQAEYDVTPDGSTVVTTWRVDEPHGDVAQHARRRWTSLRGARTPNACSSTTPTTPSTGRSPSPRTAGGSPARAPAGPPPPSPRTSAASSSRSTGGASARDVAPGWDRWITAFAWTPDSAALVVTADDGGRAPLFRVDLAGGTVTRLTDDHGAYSDPVVGPDGTVYALRSAVDAPPAPVRIDSGAGVPVPLPPPAAGARAARQPHRGHHHRRRRHARCAPGWCSPTVPPRRPPPRCCCGSTAAR